MRRRRIGETWNSPLTARSFSTTLASLRFPARHPEWEELNKRKSQAPTSRVISSQIKKINKWEHLKCLGWCRGDGDEGGGGGKRIKRQSWRRRWARMDGWRTEGWERLEDYNRWGEVMHLAAFKGEWGPFEPSVWVQKGRNLRLGGDGALHQLRLTPADFWDYFKEPQKRECEARCIFFCNVWKALYK